MCKKKITLMNAEKQNAKYPDTFKIPSRERRNNVQPGTCAKLVFNDKERMWVYVTRRYTKGGKIIYRGNLHNYPTLVNLSYNSVIVFKPKHIIGIYHQYSVDT